MALQGNPFLGKLKIPAPDLSQIPAYPFESGESDTSSQKTREVPDEVRDNCEKSTREVPDEVRDNCEKSTREVPDEVRDNCEKSTREVLVKVRDKVREKLGGHSKLLDEDFVSLVDLHTIRLKQKDVLVYLYKKAFESGGKDNRISWHVTTHELANIAQSSMLAGKDIARQLIKKQVIKIHSIVDGRGGWTNYILAKNIHADLSVLRASESLEVQEKCEKSAREVLVKVRDKVRENASSSSSSYNIDINSKTTTTENTEIAAQNEQLLPLDWERIDFSDLALLEIHFGRPQLKQWHDRKYCTAEQAQESIYHFAFYLKHAKKGEIKTGPLNFFMGIMAKQKYFPRPDGYLSPEEEAIKRRAEDLKKKNESLENLERELYYASFDSWFRSLTEDEIQNFVPTIFNYEPRKSALHGIFLDKYWLKIKSNPNVDPAKWRAFDVQAQDQTTEPISAEDARRIADQQFGPMKQRDQAREVNNTRLERV